MTRFLFGATAGSIIEGSTGLLLEARPASLRLLRPSGKAYAIQLLLIIGATFGYLGAFVFLVSSPWYQDARPWEDPPVVWAVLAGFFAGFFVVLFAAAAKSHRIAVDLASRNPRRAIPVKLRGWEPGAIVQRVLLETPDGRFIALQVEATAGGFRRAMALSGNPAMPIPPSTEEWDRAQELARPPAALPTVEVRGRANIPAFGFVASMGLLVLGYGWFLARGNLLLGLAGLGIFVPLTVYLVYFAITTRRFECPTCGERTAFSRRAGVWTCGTCHTPILVGTEGTRPHA